MLLLASFLRLLFLFVTELAAVHDAADRRFGVRGDFDEIQLCGLGDLHAFTGLNDADLLSIRTDQANLRDTDRVVYSRIR